MASKTLFQCPRCLRKFSEKEMGINPKTGKPYTKCPSCLAKNRAYFFKKQRLSTGIPLDRPKRGEFLAKKGKKICTRCLKTKPVSDFFKNANSSDGLASGCRSCKKIYSHNLYALRKSTSTDGNFDGIEDIDISFLKFVHFGKGWSYTKSCDLINAVKKELKENNGNINFGKIFKEVGCNASGFGILKEAQKAQKAGISWKKYWAEGRKFKLGNIDIKPE